MSLNLALTSALSGLQTSQKGLDLVSRNLANVNTVGYTKKIFNQESRVVSGTGAGVQPGEITRRVDSGLVKELNTENAKLESLSVKQDYFQRIQDTFGKPSDNNSIAHILSQLAEEIETLALEPDKTEQHLTTVQRAEDVTVKLNDMSDRLQRLRLDADEDIERTVSRVNTLLYDIQTLNEEVSYSEATGGDSTDLRDQRDVALNELTSLMDVTTFERNSGELTIYTKGGSILLDREVKELNHTSLASINPWDTKGGGDINGILLLAEDITDDISEGRLSALIEMRDSLLPDTQAQIDELAAELRDTVNQVNNRGSSYPNLATEYVGTRSFLDTGAQTMDIDANHNVVIGIFDSTGTQVTKETLSNILTAAGAGTPPTVQQVAGALQDWLDGTILPGTTSPNLAGPSVTFSDGASGVMEIDLGADVDNLSLVFRDEKTSDGSHDDAVISFDIDGDGTPDKEVSGFSNFFGLNDVYTEVRDDWAWDSDIKASGWRTTVGGDLQFSIPGPGNIADPNLQLTVTTGQTLQDIADTINDDTNLNAIFEAEVVTEGEGVRLRIKRSDTTEDMAISQVGGTSLMTSLGLEVSNAGLSKDLTIKDEIVSNPSLISRGEMIYNEDTTEYSLSAGDNSTANALAEAMRTARSFESAGQLPSTTRTLVDHAALTLSLNSTQASANDTRYDYQLSLVDTLSLKNAEISAVNMDEELAQLIVYEQSYAAAAKVIATTSEMFDVLNSIV